MTSFSASAPGKLILLGEYAVLRGGPSVVMAIDRRAHARVTFGVESNLLTAPEVCERSVPFTLDGGRNVSWHGVDPSTEARLHLVGEILGRFCPDEAVHLETDTSAFYEDGIKMGLGSSAALTVAAAAALARRRLDLRTLVESHRAAQGGRGSGFDVAASLHGGVLLYRAQPPEALPLTLPPGLQLRCIWTGHAASTTGFLRGLAALGPRRAALEPLVQSAEGAVASLDDRPGSWVGAIRRFARALVEFAGSTSLPILSGGHAALMEIAARHGVVYKPSGAGGGDLGIAVSEDPAAMDAFIRDLPGAPVAVPGLSVDSRGLALN